MAKGFKKGGILSWVLVAVMLTGLLPAMDVLAADTPWEGEGTVTSPYLIATAAQLAELATQVNSGTNANKYFQLTDDIDLSEYSNWTPIGKDATYAFKGIFDGNDHVITNLNINTTVSFAGLFGYARNGAVIKNLGIESGTVKGDSFVGAIVGVLGNAADKGTIEGCYNKGASISGNITVGGLAGQIRHKDSEIKNSYNAGIINSTSVNDTGAGGIIGTGYDDARITDCYNSGAVTARTCAGGIVGKIFDDANGTPKIIVTSCYNTGALTAGAGYAGGIVGHAKNDGRAKVYNSFNMGDITATSANSKRIVANNGSADTYSSCGYLDSMAFSVAGGDNGAAAYTAEQLKNPKTYVNWKIEGDGVTDPIWRIKAGSPYPVLVKFSKPDTADTGITLNFADGTVTITTTEDVAGYTLIVAGYCTGDNLVDAFLTNLGENEKTVDADDFSFNYRDERIITIKVMLWDGMKPLVEAKKIEEI